MAESRTDVTRQPGARPTRSPDPSFRAPPRTLRSAVTENSAFVGGRPPLQKLPPPDYAFQLASLKCQFTLGGTARNRGVTRSPEVCTRIPLSRLPPTRWQPRWIRGTCATAWPCCSSPASWRGCRPDRSCMSWAMRPEVGKDTTALECRTYPPPHSITAPDPVIMYPEVQTNFRLLSPRSEHETPDDFGRAGFIPRSGGTFHQSARRDGAHGHGEEPVLSLFRQQGRDRKSTRLNSSHTDISRMPSSA